jgi:hypothetical protein
MTGFSEMLIVPRLLKNINPEDILSEIFCARIACFDLRQAKHTLLCAPNSIKS